MKHALRFGLIGFCVSVQLLATGCLGGGGGSGLFSNLFGGSGESSETSQLFNPFSSGGNDGSSNATAGSGGGTGGSTSESNHDVATAHGPEPASVMLFGSGLAGLGWLKRRKRLSRSIRHGSAQ